VKSPQLEGQHYPQVEDTSLMALICKWMWFLKTENYLQELIGFNHSIQYDCSTVFQNAWNMFPMAFPWRSRQIWLNSWLAYNCSHTFVHWELHMTEYDYLVISIPTILVIFAWFCCSVITVIALKLDLFSI
jgi:hypothetical protein